MYQLLIVLTILTAVLMIGVVLIQKSKGGGLSSSFAGSNQIMGVRRTNDFIEKVTWTLAGCLCLFAVLSTFFIPTAGGNQPRVKTTVPVEQTGANYDSQLPVAAPAATEQPAPAEQPVAPAPASETAELPQ